MARKYRRVVIHNIDLTPLESKAYKAIIRHYYKGPYNVTVRFDNRLSAWGEHCFDKTNKEHVIRISPTWCTYNKKDEWRDFENKEAFAQLSKMNRHDIVCRILSTTIHELRHAKQCDDDIKHYEEEANRHAEIKQASLSYEFSPFEVDAETWALKRFNKALEKYKRLCEYEI